MKKTSLITLALLAIQLNGYSQESITNITPTGRFEIFAGKDEATHYGTENGKSVVMEIFYYNAETKTSGHADGPTQIKESEGCPIPMAVNLPSLLSGRPAISGIYSNTTGVLRGIDSMGMGVVVTPSASVIAKINIVSGKDKEFYISPDYVLFMGGSRAVEKGGPFVDVKFDASGSAAFSTIEIKRDGTLIKTYDVSSVRSSSLRLEGVRSQGDSLEWTVKDGDGKILKTASCGFPVSAATAGLVLYNISL